MKEVGTSLLDGNNLTLQFKLNSSVLDISGTLTSQGRLD